jgi:hypothetical protein
MKVLVDLLREYSSECANISGLDARPHSIADCRVNLCFAGRRWSDLLTKALIHLAVPQDVTRCHTLTVHLWDGSIQPHSRILQAYLTTLTEHWFEYAGPRGELLDVDGPPVRGFYHPGPDILSLIDLQEDTAFYWKRDLSALPYYEVGSPLRTLLHTWMRERGIHFVHAAAVGTASGGVLLAGKGGSGKSTSALACLGSSLKYAADDYCMVSLQEGQSRVHSLYNTAKLNGDEDLARFPKFAPLVWNQHRDDAEKATIFLHDHMPERLIPGFPLQAILLPMVTTDAGTHVEPCSPREALLALAPSTMAQLPASGPQDLAFFARLVRQLPCYKLLIGRNLSTIPSTIVALLKSLCPANTLEVSECVEVGP